MARWSKDRNAAARMVARSTEDARQGGRGAANGTSAWPPAAPQDPWSSLRRELDRARRYGRPLVLLQITPHGAGLSALPPEAALRRPPRRRFRPGRGVDAATLEFLRDCLRHGDELWVDRGRIFVMLPEADEDCARGLVERLCGRAPQLTAAWDVRAASFPEDGLTAGALLAQLAERAGLAAKRFAPVPLHPTPATGTSAQQGPPDRHRRAG